MNLVLAPHCCTSRLEGFPVFPDGGGRVLDLGFCEREALQKQVQLQQDQNWANRPRLVLQLRAESAEQRHRAFTGSGRFVAGSAFGSPELPRS